MQMLFVDESGTPAPPDRIDTSPIFVLGGAIIPDEFWHRVKADLDRIKTKYRISGEVKWRFFAPDNRKLHSMSHLDAAAKEALRSDLLDVLCRYKSIRAMSVIVDAARAYAFTDIKTPDDLYWYAYKTLTERFQYYLQDISRISGQRINGIIVCDHRAPKDDRRLQELHAKLLSSSHFAASKYENLIEGLFVAPSHLSVGVQFADMVAGAVLRKEKADDSRFFDQIKDTFRKSPSGQIEGYGLISFPKRGE